MQREVQTHVRQANSVRSSAKLLGVGCMTLKRLHHCQPSIGINYIKLATVETVKIHGIELLAMMEQYCSSFDFKPLILWRTKTKGRNNLRKPLEKSGFA